MNADKMNCQQKRRTKTETRQPLHMMALRINARQCLSLKLYPSPANLSRTMTVVFNLKREITVPL